jgi:protein gp37
MVFNVIQKCPQHTFMVLTKRPKIAWEHTHNTMLRPYFGLPNLWLGVTVENQEQADKRIPVLLQIPAAVRFVSVEPMLGPVNLSWIDLGEHVTQGYGPRRIIWDVLRGWEFQYEPGKERYKDLAKAKCMVSLGARMDWVICGGETGHGARPMHPDWVRSLRDQCQDAGVNFFFKQWGEFAPVGWIHSDSKGVIVRPDGYVCCDRSELASAHNYEMARVGKKKAGRFLDGREWNEMPEVCSKYPGERPDRQQAAPT